MAGHTVCFTSLIVDRGHGGAAEKDGEYRAMKAKGSDGEEERWAH